MTSAAVLTESKPLLAADRPVRGVPRRSATGVTALVTAVWLLGPWRPSGLAVGLVLLAVSAVYALALADSVGRRVLPAFLWLPIGFVTSVAVASAILLVLGVLPAGTLLGWRLVPAVLCWLLPPLGLALRRGGRIAMVGRLWPVGLLFAAVMSLGWVVTLLRPMEQWTRTVANGTDFSRHLTMVGDIVEAGGVDYESAVYPRGLHSAIALAQAPGGGSEYLTAWLALSAASWLMIALLVLSAAGIAARASSRLGLPSLWCRVLVPALVALVLLQTMWVNSFYRFGFVTSMLAGVILGGTLLAAWSPSWPAGRTPILWSCAAVLAAASSWTLLVPTAGVAFAVVAVVSFRRRQNRVLLLVSGGFAALVSLPVLGVLLGDDYGGIGLAGQLQILGDSGLAAPHWRWLVAALLALVAAVALARSGRGSWSGTWIATVLVGLLTFAALWVVNSDSWADLSYSLKTLWSLSIAILPLAIVAVAAIVVVLWRAGARVQSRPRWLAARLTIIAVVFLGSVAVLGWLSGTPNQMARILQHGGYVPLQTPVAQTLESRGITPEQGQPAVVFGLAPYGSGPYLRAQGYYDWFATETASYLGFDISNQPALKMALRNRDATAVCQFLRDQPDTLRITGPNPEAGIQWLVDSGCPDSVIRTESWVIVDIPSRWFTGLSMEGQPYSYPTWDEVQQARADWDSDRVDSDSAD